MCEVPVGTPQPPRDHPGVRKRDDHTPVISDDNFQLYYLGVLVRSDTVTGEVPVDKTSRRNWRCL